MLGAVILLLTSSFLRAQSTLGVTGLLNSPTAEMSSDRTVKIGGNFLPKQFTTDMWDYHTFNFFINITFLYFMEVSMNNTAFDLWNAGYFSNVDRSISVRFRPLKEVNTGLPLLLGQMMLYPHQVCLDMLRETNISVPIMLH